MCNLIYGEEDKLNDLFALKTLLSQSFVFRLFFANVPQPRALFVGQLFASSVAQVSSSPAVAFVRPGQLGSGKRWPTGYVIRPVRIRAGLDDG